MVTVDARALYTSVSLDSMFPTCIAFHIPMGISIFPGVGHVLSSAYSFHSACAALDHVVPLQTGPFTQCPFLRVCDHELAEQQSLWDHRGNLPAIWMLTARTCS